MFVSRPTLVALVVLALGGLATASGDLHAQTATVRVEENLRAAPNETIVGVLSPGAELRVVGRRTGWIEVELEGWVWIRSLQMADRDGHDLVVVPEESGVERENLRLRPAGPVTARLVRGALLSEVERIPGWVRVRRRAWVWSASLDVEEGGGPSTAPSSGGASAPPARAVELVPVGSRGAAILSAPDGDTVAHAAAGGQVVLLAREGSWARVRIEGWAWMPDTATVSDTAGVPAGPATPAAVAADPLAWRGRIVTWELQFISLERAEAVRTDFYEGEPFLLTRPLGDGTVPFVYVALPPERVDEGRGLAPLQRITVVGRIRVGSSTLTGSPVVDLLELRRGG